MKDDIVRLTLKPTEMTSIELKKRALDARMSLAKYFVMVSNFYEAHKKQINK